MTGECVVRIRDRITAALQPIALEVIDESHRHVGHEGARDGRGHFRVRVVSAAFIGKPLIERHRLVFDAVGEMMRTDIHALAVEARAPAEM